VRPAPQNENQMKTIVDYTDRQSWCFQFKTEHTNDRHIQQAMQYFDIWSIEQRHEGYTTLIGYASYANRQMMRGICDGHGLGFSICKNKNN